MSQNDLSIANADGATFRADVNSALQAQATKQSGTSAPSTHYPNQEWADTTNAVLKRRDNGDTVWRITDSLDTARVLAKTGTYTVAINDFSKTIDATSGTWTLNLLAVATAGDGFWFMLRNTGSGVITIDPNSSEQVDGATTKTIPAGFSCLVVCNGSLWRTVGISPDLVGDSGSGGTRGLVPAPASGDAAAGKFLKADATWAAPTTITTGTQLVKNPYATSSRTTQAHGLGVKPKGYIMKLVCLTAEGNFSIGDEVILSAGYTYNNGAGGTLQIDADATNVNLNISGTVIQIQNKTTQAFFSITAANWKVTVDPFTW